MDNPVIQVTLGKIYKTTQTHNTENLEMRNMDLTKIP